MSDAKDGGWAFATGNPQQGGQQGMTLRDYFAGQVLAGMLSDYEGMVKVGKTASEIGMLVTDAAAQSAYEFADAMLSQRTKGEE